MLEGDEWKRAKEPQLAAMSRAEAQRIVNDLFADGVIDREDWSNRFDKISEPKFSDYEAATR